MELRHLRYFVAVAEEQNVTRAAARLHVSQPPLSRQIRDLESELGFSLFEHGPKSVKLTPAGQVFLKRSRELLQQTEAAVQEAKAVANGERGEIHIGYAPSLAVDLLPQALRAFEKESRGIRVELHDLSTQEMVRGLRNGRLDVAYIVQVSKKLLAEFSFTELRQFAVCVAMSPTHPLAKANKIALEQIVSEPIIGFTLADYPEHHLWLTNLFAPLNRAPRIREEHDSVSSLVAAVEAGRGVALVLEPFKCFAPRVKLRVLSPPPPPVPFGIACSKGKVPQSVRDFIAAARQSTERFANIGVEERESRRIKQ